MSGHATHDQTSLDQHSAHGDHADAWHHHDPAVEGLPMAEKAGTINVASLMGWFVGLIIGLVVLVGILHMYYESVKTQEWARKVETTGYSAGYNAYKASSTAQIAPNGYELLDPAKGVARAPIDVVMRRVADQYAAGIPVPPPAPASSAAAAPAASGGSR